MNEVNFPQSTGITASTKTSTVEYGGSNRFSSDAVNELSPTGGGQVSRPQAIAADVINQAVIELNNYVQNEQRDLLFSVDDGSGSVVVKVVDRDSGELIRQIPNDIVLDLAARARENEAIQLVNMYG